GTVVPTGIQLGLGVRTAAVTMDIRQGTLTQTGNDLDLAVEGKGFFEIVLPSGERAFTRDGKFELDPDGQMVTPAGFALVDGITIPRDVRQVEVSADGNVFAYFDNAVDGQSIGNLTLVSFVNEKGLEAMGGNLYRQTEASGDPVTGQPGQEGLGFIQQGYLEDSSVNVVSEIAELIEAQRGYEMNSKVLSAADEMYSAATRIR
ncbi:MAG: flagellar hook-basal body complex protein, partial [Pseudomonadota bacterium]